MAPIHAQTYVGPLPRWIFNVSKPLVVKSVVRTGKIIFHNYKKLRCDLKTFFKNTNAFSKQKIFASANEISH